MPEDTRTLSRRDDVNLICDRVPGDAISNTRSPNEDAAQAPLRLLVKHNKFQDCETQITNKGWSKDI